MRSDLTPLAFKPNFADAVRRMQAFWAGEIIDRPACGITAPLPVPEGEAPGAGGPNFPPCTYLEGAREELEPIVQRVVWDASRCWWGGEAMPAYTPSFGPDQFAAWMGADLRWSDSEEGTNWVAEFVDDWAQVFPLRIETEGHWWQRTLKFLQLLGEAARGKMIISHLDLHSNADALSAIRTPAKLCLDFYDCPYLLDKAMRQVRGLYPFVYESLFQAGQMRHSGSQGWVSVWHWGRTNTIQCDFLALIGPDLGRRYIMPALEEEAAYLDACVLHYDGPECLVHLEDILALERLYVIQWTPGARNKAMFDWLDLLQRIQAAGKGLWISTTAEEVKRFMKELRPEGVYYQIGVDSPEEGEQVLEWMVKNT